MAKDKGVRQMETKEQAVSEDVKEQPVVEETPAPAPVEPPVEAAPVAPVVAVEEVKEEAIEEDAFAVLIDSIVSDDPTLAGLKAVFDSYVEKMAPGKMVRPDSGALANLTLLRAITTAADNYDARLFKRAWTLVLAYFEQHADGVFSDRYAFRFPDAWGFGDEALQAYQSIITLCKVTAEPNARKAALKQLDLNKVLEFGLTEEGRSKIVSFYR